MTPILLCVMYVMSLIQNVFWTISSTQHILLSVCMLIKCVCYIFISLISIELIIIKRSDSFTISKNWIGEMLIWRLIMNRRIGWLQLFYIIHSNGLCHSFHEHNHKKSELEDGIVILSIVVQDDLKNMIHSSIRFLSDVGLITEQEYQSVSSHANLCHIRFNHKYTWKSVVLPWSS